MATALTNQRARVATAPHPASSHDSALLLRRSAPADVRHILRSLLVVCAIATVPAVYLYGYSAQTQAAYARAKLRSKLRMLNLDHQRLKKAVDQARNRRAIEAWAEREGMLLDAPPYVVREPSGS